jgi:hypothetical protein
MTARELIKELEKLPPDMPIYTYEDSQDNFYPTSDVQIHELNGNEARIKGPDTKIAVVV